MVEERRHRGLKMQRVNREGEKKTVAGAHHTPPYQEPLDGHIHCYE